MSKISMPRPRYIAFRIEGPQVSRRSLGNAIRSASRTDGWADGDAPQLTRYAWPHGIVRVEHTFALKARGLLARIALATEGDRKLPIRIEPTGTSGTLKALTGRLGVLQARDPTPSRPA